MPKALHPILFALVLFLLPSKALAACEAERPAYESEIRSDPNFANHSIAEVDSRFMALMDQDVGNDVAKIKEALNEPTGDVPPGVVNYLKCQLRLRLAHVQSASAPETAATAPRRGPSCFAGAGGEGSSVAETSSAPSASSGCNLSQGEAHLGALSTESVSVHNDCPTHVSFVYCVTSSNGGGAFGCAEGHFGTDGIRGSGDGYKSVQGASSPFETHLRPKDLTTARAR